MEGKILIGGSQSYLIGLKVFFFHFIIGEFFLLEMQNIILFEVRFNLCKVRFNIEKLKKSQKTEILKSYFLF